MQAHVLQLPNRPGAVLLDDVRHGDHAQQPAVPAEKQRRFSGFSQRFGQVNPPIGNLRPAND